MRDNSAFVVGVSVAIRGGPSQLCGRGAVCSRRGRAWLGTSSFSQVAGAGVAARAARRPSRRAGVRCQLPGNIEDIPVEPIPPLPLDLPDYWARAGVYGVYSTTGVLQYVSAAHDVRLAIDSHRATIGDEAAVAMVRMLTVDDADEAPLGQVAENWVLAMESVGQLPPGNSDAAPDWRIPPKAPPVTNVKFAGSGLGAEAEIKNILRDHSVVLFMKGTREEPKCGFSAHVLEILERAVPEQTGFVCVNCLDESNNPGLREGIKEYSAWPTIPQLYIDGDFVGGADIVTEMEENGELAAALA